MRKKRKKKLYKEGDWFGVPLMGGGYAIGLIAREKSSGILGYFFAPKREVLPSLSELKEYKPQDTIFIAMFSYLGLYEDGWPIIGKCENCNRNDWPIPIFGNIDSIDSTKGSLRIYDPDDIYNIIEEIPCSVKEANKYPEDGSWGSIALQYQLSKLLLSKDERAKYLETESECITEPEWSYDPFSNDDAKDWFSDLKITKKDWLKYIKDTFDKILNNSGYLELPESNNAIAAAEIISAMRGKQCKNLPKSIKRWIQRHKREIPDEIVNEAIYSIQRILSGRDCELYELWKENKDFEKWIEEIKNLLERLKKSIAL